MANANDLVIASFDDPSENILKDYIGRLKMRQIGRWKPSSSAHLLVFIDQLKIERSRIDTLNKIKDELNLLLIHQEKNDFNFFLKEFVSHLSQKILMKTITFTSKNVFDRIISAWGSGAEHKLISDAYIVDDKLVFSDCASTRYEIESKFMPEIKVGGKLSENFEIHPDGNYLHWPDFDFHINIEALRSRFDEKFKTNQMLKYAHLNSQFGIGVKRIREKHHLKQTDFGKISERQIRRIENGQSNPSYGTLKTMSGAHGLSLKEYLNEISENSNTTA